MKNLWSLVIILTSIAAASRMLGYLVKYRNLPPPPAIHTIALVSKF